MSGKIYSYPNNWRVKRIESVALLSGFKLEVIITDAEGRGTPEFLAKFPTGCVPAFETEGLTLVESAAIAEYVGTNGTTSAFPTDPKELALVNQWINVTDQEIAARVQIASGMMSYIPYNKPVYDSLIAKVSQRLEQINKVLADKTFLVGDRLSVADITLASALAQGFSGHLDAAVRAKCPNVVRLVETIIKSKQFSPIFGEIPFSETAPKYQAPKKETAAPKEKEAAAPKAPKAKKPVEKDDDEEEDLVPAEPKVKNPLDDLPKSEFKLDDWKRSYSNEDTRTGALPWFYKNFDAEGFSVWRVDFKYPSELTQVFMSSNLVGGFFNRLEGARKYAFGSLAVYGTANDSLISGAFVIRGKDYKQVLDCAPDWESYDYTPLDLSKAEDKEFFEGAMAWDASVGGKPFADGKTFK